MAGCGKRAHNSSDSEDQEHDHLSPPPPPPHVKRLADEYSELGTKAIEMQHVGMEGLYTVLRKALGDLCERFKDADRLSRPFTIWELHNSTREELSKICNISDLKTTPSPKPVFYEEPIASQAYDSLNKILEFSDESNLFRHILEWCESGRVPALGIEDGHTEENEKPTEDLSVPAPQAKRRRPRARK